MKNPVLVLNSDYMPHRIVTWQSAFVLVYSKDNGAYLVSSYDKVIHDSAGRPYNIPAVVVLSQYISSNNKRATFSRRNIYLRDRYTCQYCGNTYTTDKLNIDHIVPRSKPEKLGVGVKMNSFENCVTACIPCNSKKADRTLEEAKMSLIRSPRVITRGQKLYYDIIHRMPIPPEWLPYIESMKVND